MAKIFHFVLLGILAIIKVTNCYNDCNLPPLRNYKYQCMGSSGLFKGKPLTHCILTTSGLISDNGMTNMERFREIIIPYVVACGWEKLDEIGKLFKNCYKKVMVLRDCWSEWKVEIEQLNDEAL